MTDEISVFVEFAYVGQKQTDVVYSLDILDKVSQYGYLDNFTQILLGSPDATMTDLADRFFLELDNVQRDLLYKQNIVLTREAEFHNATLMLEGFVNFQNLADYTDISRFLETDLNYTEMMLEIFSNLTTLSKDVIFSICSEFKPDLKKALADYIRDKTKSSSDITPMTVEQREIIENFKLFRRYLNGKYCLGMQLVDSGYIPGFTIKDIMGLLYGGITNTDPKKTALDIMSVLYLCIDGYKDVSRVYKRLATDIMDGIGNRVAIDTIVTTAILEFDQFKKSLQK